MLTFLTGDLLKSDADALVNTVNCEGYMGKGIAYQFKLQYPETNESYAKACKSGKLRPGKLHTYREQGKLIVNFPTKDKWRCKSKMEYIDSGLEALVDLIVEEKIKSIAIPPLGSGHGGLEWNEVKERLREKLSSVDDSVDIRIYEPSRYYASKPKKEPKLSESALVLIEIKKHLKKKTNFRLQKAAFFLNLFSSKQLFDFKAQKYGPYSHAVELVGKKIKEFADYYNTESLDETEAVLYGKLVSESVNTHLEKLKWSMERSWKLVNDLDENRQLEGVATACFIIENLKCADINSIIGGFRKWSKEKSDKFTDEQICFYVEWLYEKRLISKTLTGYEISFSD